jgi:hypothetical protein
MNEGMVISLNFCAKSKRTNKDRNLEKLLCIRGVHKLSHMNDMQQKMSQTDYRRSGEPCLIVLVHWQRKDKTQFMSKA